MLYTQFGKEKRNCTFSMYFRTTKIQLVYSWQWQALAPPSVLYCRVYLSKNSGVYLHLPELLCSLGVDDYRACYFPYIETGARMEACFHALMAVVEEYIPALEQLGQTGGDQEILAYWQQHPFFEQPTETEAAEEPEKIENAEQAENLQVLSQRIMESVMVARHTLLDAYEAFLLGDWEKSLEKYRKLEKSGLSDYERGLCRFLEDDRNRGFVPMPPECLSAADYKLYAGAKTDWRGCVLLYIPCAAICCSLIGLMSGILSRGTIFFFGVEWWFGLVIGVFPALFGYGVLERQVLALMGGPHRRRRLDYCDMMDSRSGLTKLLKVVFAVAVAGSLWFCIAVPGMSIRFYDTYGVYYTEEGATVQFAYDQMAGIYYTSARYNSFGGRLERPSYVLVLENGEQVDLDACTWKLDKQRQIIETLFPEAEIAEVDSL